MSFPGTSRTSSEPVVSVDESFMRKRRSLNHLPSPHQTKCLKDNQSQNTQDVIILPSKQEIISDGRDEEHTSAYRSDFDASHKAKLSSSSPSVTLENSPPAVCGYSDDVNVLTSRHDRPPITSCNPVPGPSNCRQTSPVLSISLHNIEISKSESTGKVFSSTNEDAVTNGSAAQDLTQESTKKHEHIVCGYDIGKLCDSQDNKTKFLLSMIEKYLQNDNLRCLLDDESQELLAKCMHVTNPGMKLVCKLFWFTGCRRWHLIRRLIQMSKGNNAEISQLHLDELVENGLIVQSATQGKNCMNIDEYGTVLTHIELHRVYRKLKIQPPSFHYNNMLIFELNKFSRKKVSDAGQPKGTVYEPILKTLYEIAGPCYRLSDLASNTLTSLYMLMYLGIDYSLICAKRLESILASDKNGREIYPVDKNMAIDNACVVFQNRNQFKQYMTAYSLYVKYAAANKSPYMDFKDIVKEAYESYLLTSEEDMLRFKSFPVWLRRFTSPSIYIDIMENSIKRLTQYFRSYQEALNILNLLIDQNTYYQSKKLVWYDKMALIYHENMNQPEKAAGLLLKGFATDYSEDAKEILRPRARLLADQMDIVLSEEVREALNAHADRPKIEEKNLPINHIFKKPSGWDYEMMDTYKFDYYIKHGLVSITVEEYCILHYTELTRTFTHGNKWESDIVKTIFFLLFWDIIYMKPDGVSGIFLTYYQKYPLDLFYDSFYVNRRTLIEDRLTFIEQSLEDIVIELMKRTWDSRPDAELSEIRRDIGWENIRMVVQCLGARPLAAICRRLAVYYRDTHSGFPSVTLWNIRTKKIKFVEVTQDSYKPTTKKNNWLRYLIDHGIDAGFCYVGCNYKKIASEVFMRYKLVHTVHGRLCTAVQAHSNLRVQF